MELKEAVRILNGFIRRDEIENPKYIDARAAAAEAVLDFARRAACFLDDEYEQCKDVNVAAAWALIDEARAAGLLKEVG